MELNDRPTRTYITNFITVVYLALLLFASSLALACLPACLPVVPG